MRILLDTSVLVRTSHRDSYHYQAAFDAVNRLLLSAVEVCIVPQVLYEYWVVATRPTANNGLGHSADQASEKLDEFIDLYSLKRDERSVFDSWRGLIRQFAVLGKSAHDTRLVAAMQRHGIPAILTLNARDFGRYPNIVVYTPESLPEDLDQLDDPMV